MKLPGLKAAKQAARWLGGQIRGGVLILGYHRVDRPALDPYAMCVSPQHFAEQLAVLESDACPVSLLELVQRIEARRLPKRAVVLTFDDGYADFSQAQALLERYHVPATLFVSPAYLGREFWWDELARILFSPATLPERFSIELGDTLYKWAIDDPVKVVWNRTPSSPRQRLLLELYRRLLPLSGQERQVPMEQLRIWAGQGVEPEPQCRVLKGDELVQVSTAREVDIGLHSMTHPVLAKLSVKAQQVEIEQGRAYIRELLGRPVNTFSYPNGSFSKETATLVENAGFVCACASQDGLARQEGQLYHLPRFWVPDWDGVTFSRWLQWWLSS